MYEKGYVEHFCSFETEVSFFNVESVLKIKNKSGFFPSRVCSNSLKASYMKIEF